MCADEKAQEMVSKNKGKKLGNIFFIHQHFYRPYLIAHNLKT